MAKVILGKERRKADRIIRCLPRPSIVANELGISRQLLNYRMKNTYPEQIADFIKLLDLAGYSIIEKENEDDKDLF